MNVIDTLIERIERRAKETKTPCKLYSSYEAADRAGSKIASEVGDIHESRRGANYVVFEIPSLGKWTAAIDLTGLLSRPETVGGYVGYAGQKGFYTY